MGRFADQADILVESEIRQRRPIIREGPVIDEMESDVGAESTKNQLEDGTLAQTSIRRHLNSVLRSLIVRLLKPYRIEASLMAERVERPCVVSDDRHHFHHRLHPPRSSFLHLNPAWWQVKRRRR